MNSNKNDSINKLKPSREEKEIQKSQEEFFKSQIKQSDILLLLYILKTTTNSENAMSVSELSDQLDTLIPSFSEDSYFPDRTMRRKFEYFTNLAESNNSVLSKINNILPYVFGGNVASRSADGIHSGKNVRGNGKQKRFYFDPVLTTGDMELICGSINSNRFLSEQEKDYLLARLSVLLPDYNLDKDRLSANSFRNIEEIKNLPKRPEPDKSSDFPTLSKTLLTNIQRIHEAIESKVQIEVIYGTYDMDKVSKKINFHPRNEGKPYILNPYAMLWNDGEYYLVATDIDNASAVPVHFRIDRIISVKVHTIKNEDGTLSEKTRNKIPASLSTFFVRKKGEKPIFDAIKYTNTYPGMIYHSEPRLIDCTFECNLKSLLILIDHFGPNISLSPSPIEHSDEELDNHGLPETFLSAKIKNVQYDNALRFCIHYADSLTLLGPDELIKDVSQKLMNIYNKYNH